MHSLPQFSTICIAISLPTELNSLKTVLIHFDLSLFSIITFHTETVSRGRNAGCPAPPTQSRTCGFPASGSSVTLASARIFTVARYKAQLLFPAVRFACMIQPYMSGAKFPLRATCFRQVLSRNAESPIRSNVVWLAFPTSEYYA